MLRLGVSELSTNGGQKVCVGLCTILSMAVVGTITVSGITESVACRSATFNSSTELLLSGDIYESSENIPLSDISLFLLGVSTAWWFPVIAE